MPQSKRIFGNTDGGTLIQYKGYPKITRTGDNFFELVDRYSAGQKQASSLVPYHGSACTYDGYEDLKLTETRFDPNGTPGMVDVTFIYKSKGGGSSDHVPNETQYSSSISSQELDIADERLVESGLMTSQQQQELKAAGARTQTVGGLDWTKTEWLPDDTEITETFLTQNIGTVQNPEGITSPTLGKWMLVGRTLRLSGDLFEYSQTWRYHAPGWFVATTTTTTTTP